MSSLLEVNVLTHKIKMIPKKDEKPVNTFHIYPESIVQLRNEQPDRRMEYLEGEVLRLRAELSREQGNLPTCMETCSALNSIQEGLIRFGKVKGDKSIRCIFANEQFQNMTGFKLPDLVGRGINWFFAPNRKIHRPVGLSQTRTDGGVTLETAIKTNFNYALPSVTMVRSPK